MKTKDIIEGLTILEKYRRKPDGYNTSSEHDQIYAYATDSPVSESDINRLVEIGWFQDEVKTEGEEFSAKHYNPESSWSCHI